MNRLACLNLNLNLYFLIFASANALLIFPIVFFAYTPHTRSVGAHGRVSG